METRYIYGFTVQNCCVVYSDCVAVRIKYSSVYTVQQNGNIHNVTLAGMP